MWSAQMTEVNVTRAVVGSARVADRRRPALDNPRRRVLDEPVARARRLTARSAAIAGAAELAGVLLVELEHGGGHHRRRRRSPARPGLPTVRAWGIKRTCHEASR